MRVSLARSALVSVTLLVLLLLWELLTFELPREQHMAVGKQNLAIHVVLLASLTVGSLVGAFLGFAFFPRGRALTHWRLAALGAMLFVLLFFAIAPLASVGGFVAAFVGALVLAVCCSSKPLDDSSRRMAPNPSTRTPLPVNSWC